MTQIRDGGNVFRTRAAGVAVHDGRVLLARPAPPSSWKNWALIGGGVEMHESSDAAVVREFREELGVEPRVGRLLWCVENHFRHEAETWHEIGLYWEVELPPEFKRAESGRFLDHVVSEDRIVPTEWTWHPIDRLHDVDLRPTFLIDGLRDPPRATRFLVHDDRPRRA